MRNTDIEQIVRREASLNTASVRAVPHTVLAILDEEFVEIDSTGRFWNAVGVAEALSRNPEPHEVDMDGARGLRLADDAYLLTYGSASRDAATRHTSVWVRKDHQWRMVFHQQTRVS